MLPINRFICISFAYGGRGVGGGNVLIFPTKAVKLK